MKRSVTPALFVPFVLVMVGTIVVVDVLLFRHNFWERLVANIAIVLVFVAAYYLFLKRS
jgi:hypothetical protein